ncbi:MAG: tail component protein [Caudoviricetes sp.]|nr:MAG: tail component protein [Caudoviricetes sp.]
MHDVIRTIRLYGVLGARFGRVHRFVCNSPAEAVSALCRMVDGFQEFLARSEERGLVYSVFLGKRNLAAQDFDVPPGPDDIRIAPVLQGSKRAGVLQTVIGAVLIAVGAYTGQLWLVKIGAAIALSGVAQMLSPVAKGLGNSDKADNKPSYSFTGPVNTTAQGNPVPILYGEMIVGSAVISSGIMSEDQQ